MNKQLLKRLQALADRAHDATSGIVPFGFVTDANGDIEAYTIPALGKTLTPDEFYDLVQKWEDVVFFPNRPIPDRTCDAYYKLEEEALLTVSWADLQAENEAVERARAEGREFEGPGAVEAAMERARAADPERAALADEYAEGWVESCEWFYHPMRERAERLSKKRGW